MSVRMDAVAALSSYLDDMMHFLEASANDPLSFSVIFLIYTVLAAVFLPIPVEVGLFFSPATPVAVKIFVMGLGKMLGSMLVFSIGLKLGDEIKDLSASRRFLTVSERCLRSIRQPV